MEETIRERIKGLNKEAAINVLETIIFNQEIAEYMDFELVAVCKKLIKELKGGC